jgi:muramoyltetrapeptide carboxypeptidase
MNYTVATDRQNRPGEAVGTLLGGNLALFAHLVGSNSFPDTRGAILFLEDVGEQLYNIDRMLRQLKRGGYLDGLSGVMFGGFTECKDTEPPFGQDFEQILESIVREYEFPVCYNFPVSHTERNYPLKYGVRCRLTVSANSVSLQEIVE